jgi:hypothetical protein
MEVATCAVGADLIDGIPVVNPRMRLRVYRWPVHRLGPGFYPEEAPAVATCFVVFCSRDEGVAFTQLTPVTVRLVELM